MLIRFCGFEGLTYNLKLRFFGLFSVVYMTFFMGTFLDSSSSLMFISICVSIQMQFAKSSHRHEQRGAGCEEYLSPPKLVGKDKKGSDK